MTASDEMRAYLKRQRYADRVIEGGVPYLIENWERDCQSVDQDLDLFINSLDGRRILAEVLPLLLETQRNGLLPRLAEADKAFLSQTEPAESVIGPEGLGRPDYDRQTLWWYWRVPKVRDKSWLEAANAS